MLENSLSPRPQRHPGLNLLLLIIMVGVGFAVVGLVVGLFIALPFYPGSATELISALEDPTNHPDVKIPFYIIQASSTLIGLIVIPAVYMSQNQTSIMTFFRERVEWVPVAITFFVVIIFSVVNSVFIEWNAGFHFPEFVPDFLRKFESWAREREDTAQAATKFLTQFESVSELAIALVVIAVLPAIGEEIVFRGLIQNEMVKATGKLHLSIWITAALFSAIHIQFFGFIPRLLLGALFGYLYYWSGNLTLAIIAHFVNNGVSVVAMYFYQKGAFEFDIESSESAPLNVVVISAVLTAGLLYYFYKYFENRKPAINQP